MLHRLDRTRRDSPRRPTPISTTRVSIAALSAFMNADLSAFYFDIRKDALYCEPPSSARRRGALEAIDHIFRAVTIWLAPILVFTSEEAWASRDPSAHSVHLEQFPDDSRRLARRGARGAMGDDPPRCARSSPARSRSRAPPRRSARRWRRIRASSSSDPALAARARGRRFRRSLHHLRPRDRDRRAGAGRRLPPAGRRRASRSSSSARAGVKCARSWRYFDPATADPRLSRRHPARRRGVARTRRGAVRLDARAHRWAPVAMVAVVRARPGGEVRGPPRFRCAAQTPMSLGAVPRS